jgi:hypothetical protein
VRVPQHEPGPPETLTDTGYANLPRVPDRRTLARKRDYAPLRVLGDRGPRSAELRGLPARDLRRPRSNARHYRLFVRGKRGRACEVPVPLAARRAAPVREPRPSRTRAAPPALRRRRAPARAPQLRGHRHARAALSPAPAARLLGHALPRGRRPRCTVSAMRGHVDLRTTARYVAPRPEQIDDIADVLDRRHQAARRAHGMMLRVRR